MNNPLN